MRGGVPLEQHLRRMTSESLFAHPVPAVVGMTHVGAEQTQRVLVTADRRLLATRYRAQVAEEFLDHRGGPGPWKLVGICQEPLNEPDPLCDGVVCKVAAELLVAPTLKHLPNRLCLGMQQRNRADNVEAATSIDGQNGLRQVSSDES